MDFKQADSLDIWERHPKQPFDQDIKTTQRWMANCLESHGRCQMNTELAFYPTRLLKLEEDRARLIISAEEEPGGPYLALSYAGVKPTFHRLQDSTLEELHKCIAISCLPAPFRKRSFSSQGSR